MQDNKSMERSGVGTEKIDSVLSSCIEYSPDELIALAKHYYYEPYYDYYQKLEETINKLFEAKFQINCGLQVTTTCTKESEALHQALNSLGIKNEKKVDDNVVTLSIDYNKISLPRIPGLVTNFFNIKLRDLDRGLNLKNSATALTKMGFYSNENPPNDGKREPDSTHHVIM